MRIDELKRIAEENDYTCWTTIGDFYIFKRKMSMKHIKIKKSECNRIYILRFDFCDEKDCRMINACMDLSYTHPDDREEEKKFYLKHRWLTSCGWNYVSVDSKEGPILDDDSEYDYKKPKFTLKEIEEIKKKFNTDLKDFELVEVEE